MEKRGEDMGQKYLFECEDCGAKFVLGEGGAELHCGVPCTVEDSIRWSIYLTYYDCPKCGRRHYVQVDNERTIEIKRKASYMFVKLSKRRLDFKDIPKEQNKKFKKLNERLAKARFELKQKLDGKIFTAKDGSEFEVHFSM